MRPSRWRARCRSDGSCPGSKARGVVAAVRPGVTEHRNGRPSVRADWTGCARFGPRATWAARPGAPRGRQVRAGATSARLPTAWPPPQRDESGRAATNAGHRVVQRPVVHRASRSNRCLISSQASRANKWALRGSFFAREYSRPTTPRAGDVPGSSSRKRAKKAAYVVPPASLATEPGCAAAQLNSIPANTAYRPAPPLRK